MIINLDFSMIKNKKWKTNLIEYHTTLTETDQF